MDRLVGRGVRVLLLAGLLASAAGLAPNGAQQVPLFADETARLQPSHSDSEQDRVHSLPGWEGELPSALYSGCETAAPGQLP